MDDSVYFYSEDVEKGLWIDVETIDSWEEIFDELVEAEIIPPDYDGDILSLGAEGLAEEFSTNTFFKLEEYIECRDNDGSPEAKKAFIDVFGEWNSDGFEYSYHGQYDDEVDFTENYIENVGLLDGVPERLRWYFDVEKFARHLFINDFIEYDGHIFYRN